MKRRFDERGQAAGLESIPFGILVFVGGLLLVVNLWAVVDQRAALDTAARDYLRAYTAAPTGALARQAGEAAALSSIGARASEADLRIVEPDEPFGPCRPATVTLRLDIEAIRAPFIGSTGSTTITSTRTELVQPYGRAIDESSGVTTCDG